MLNVFALIMASFICSACIANGQIGIAALNGLFVILIGICILARLP